MPSIEEAGTNSLVYLSIPSDFDAYVSAHSRSLQGRFRSNKRRHAVEDRRHLLVLYESLKHNGLDLEQTASSHTQA